MKVLLLTLLSLGVLSGCVNPNITTEDYKIAGIFCESREGVKALKVTMWGSKLIACNAQRHQYVDISSVYKELTYLYVLPE